MLSKQTDTIEMDWSLYGYVYACIARVCAYCVCPFFVVFSFLPPKTSESIDVCQEHNKLMKDLYLCKTFSVTEKKLHKIYSKYIDEKNGIINS